MKIWRIIVLSITLVLVLFVTVMAWELSHVDLTNELKFSFTIDGIEEIIYCWKNVNGEYEAFVPGFVDLGCLKINLNPTNKVFINQIEVSDGIFCDIFLPNTPYDITYCDRGVLVTSRITFRCSSDIPSIHICTESKNLKYLHASKKNKEKGSIRIYTAQGKLNYAGDLEHITGRGNSTWSASEKKSYGIKLFQEVDLLGKGTAQKWVLLANSFDESNLKNKLVFDFSEEVGVPFSSNSQWTDLYLNNEYVGLYLFCEKVEVHPERVNIANEASSLVSMEYESRLTSQGLPYVSTDARQALRIHYPENPSEQDLEKAKKLWQSVENAIMSKSGIDVLSGRKWDELIDVDSWARKYLVEEIFGNLDAAFLSQYFYIDGTDADAKAYAGPVWDYDSTFGSVWQTSSPNAWCANRLLVEDGYEAPWFYSLCQKPEFMKIVISLYAEEFIPLLYELTNEGIQRSAEKIYAAVQMNSIRWNITNDLDTLVSEMETYLDARVTFLSDVWLEGTEYVYVQVTPEYGGHYAYVAIRKGDTLAKLPNMTNTKSFAGWYYSNTNAPIDEDALVLNDMTIYSKWNAVSTRAESRIKQLMPLGIIAVLGFIIFALEICSHMYRARKKNSTRMRQR